MIRFTHLLLMQVNHIKIGLGPIPRGPKATSKRKLCAHDGCLKQVSKVIELLMFLSFMLSRLFLS